MESEAAVTGDADIAEGENKRLTAAIVATST
jgi:hypothetical protein